MTINIQAKLDIITLLARQAGYDGAYNNSSLTHGVFVRCFGLLESDFGSQKSQYQVDHFVPQNPHLNPQNPFDVEFIRALELPMDQGILAVTGNDIIRAVFKKCMPECPDALIPSQDHIVNLRPMMGMSNNVKSNRLSGTMETIFETIVNNAFGYQKYMDAQKMAFSPKSMIKEFCNDETELCRVLKAIDAVDRMRCDRFNNRESYLIVPNVDLYAAFTKATELLSTTTVEDNFMLQRYVTKFSEGKIDLGMRTADRLEGKLDITNHFTGSIVDLTTNFRESYDRFRPVFLSYAIARLEDAQEERVVEKAYGRPSLQAA